MHILTEEEFQREAEPVLLQVFRGNDDIEPFLPSVKERLFLYFPLGDNIERNVYWERKLAEALCEAAQSIGDPGCYLASAWQGRIVTSDGRPHPKNRYAFIRSSELLDALAAPCAPYESSKRVWSQLNIVHGCDFCLCSVTGRWGLLTSIDDHGFLGGTPEFMQVVRHVFPDIDTEVSVYLHDLRLEQIYGDGIDLPFVKQILSHVYGLEKAEQMITNAELA